METVSEDFLRVLKAGGTAANVWLRVLHNRALKLDWLVRRVLAQREQQSTTLAPDGAGKTVAPSTYLTNLNLTKGWFYQADLSGTSFLSTNLTNADFVGANLSNTFLDFSTLTNTDFSNATITGTSLFNASGFTASQLYSTASYQARNLSGVRLPDSLDLYGGDLSNQNLSNARLTQATLTNADFSGANLSSATLSSATLTGANFSGATITGASFASATGFTASQLYSTASYQAHNLSGVSLPNLNNADFSNQDLSKATLGSAFNANFSGANLSNANLVGLNGGNVTGANFSGATITGATMGSGFTAAQLYSTASYQAHDLSGVKFYYNINVNSGVNLSGADLSNQNLSNTRLTQATLTNADFSGANFSGADLTNADLTGADARGASNMAYATVTRRQNFVQPDGVMQGLALQDGETLRIWDYNGGSPLPITVTTGFTLATDSTLRLVFEDSAWGSTLVIADGVNVTLDGELILALADGLTPADLGAGTNFQIFDWSNAGTITGQFDGIVLEGDYDGYTWDTSNLYTTGEITLVAVPEPSVLGLLGVFAGVALLRRTTRRKLTHG